MVLDKKFDIEKRDEIIDPIDQGAYGVVIAVRDIAAPEGSCESNLVAIKKL